MHYTSAQKVFVLKKSVWFLLVTGVQITFNLYLAASYHYPHRLQEIPNCQMMNYC